VKLAFTSEETRVEVYEGDVLLGTTPLTLSRPPGTLAVFRFEAKGFTGQEKKLRFEADTTVPIALEKAPHPKVKLDQPTARPAPREEALKEVPY
jgi:hypothetical protein